MKEQVLKTIHEQEMLQKKDGIVVGVSGGPDSITLLDLLASLQEEWTLKLYVAHINHGIRKEASDDEEYVKAYCQKKKIPCFVKHIQVEQIAEERKISTETAGREERYAFYEEIAQKVGTNRIATAHTANDNAETILMNLIRGSGISGLKGIEPVRGGRYIRPLINCTRKQIEAYCEEKNLKPCIDQTNFENIYTRNKIRNQLLPMLEKEFNPNIITGLNRLRKFSARRRSLLGKRTSQHLSSHFARRNQAGNSARLESISKIRTTRAKQNHPIHGAKTMRNHAEIRKNPYSRYSHDVSKKHRE